MSIINYVESILSPVKLYDEFKKLYTSSVNGTDVRVIGSKSNGSIDFSNWVDTKNIRELIPAELYRQIVKNLDHYTSNYYHQVYSNLGILFGDRNEFFGSDNEVTPEVKLADYLNRLITQDPIAIDSAHLYAERVHDYATAVACLDYEPLHARANNLSVSTSDGVKLEAIVLSNYANPEFWATSKKARKVVDEFWSARVLQRRWISHVENERVVIHTDPVTGYQTWLTDGDLLVQSSIDENHWFPLPYKTALAIGYIIKVPVYEKVD